jgi:hypothetical protein
MNASVKSGLSFQRSKIADVPKRNAKGNIWTWEREAKRCMEKTEPISVKFCIGNSEMSVVCQELNPNAFRSLVIRNPYFT